VQHDRSARASAIMQTCHTVSRHTAGSTSVLVVRCWRRGLGVCCASFAMVTSQRRLITNPRLHSIATLKVRGVAASSGPVTDANTSKVV
jgi:hypothetical protein